MASSTDGYKDTKDAKDFQEWIEINRSRHAHETLLDQLSTSSLSSSSSHELINQCGKGFSNGIGAKGKKVRFKKKLRRSKDHNLNYRNGYYRGEDRRNGRPSQLCHLVKLFSTFAGFIALVALIFVVINIQTRIDLLQVQLRSLNDHYLGMATTLSVLKKKSQEQDNLIVTLSTNLSACRNNSKLETNDDSSNSGINQPTTAINSKTLADLTWLPNRVNELSSQVNRLTVNISHCSNKMSNLEAKMNLSSQTEDGLSRSFAHVNNVLVENSSKLEHLTGLIDHLMNLTSNLTAPTNNVNH